MSLTETLNCSSERLVLPIPVAESAWAVHRPGTRRGIDRSNPSLHPDGQLAESKSRDRGVRGMTRESTSPDGFEPDRPIPIVLGYQTTTSDCSACGS